MNTIVIILSLMGLYLVAGLVFAIAFASRGAAAIDHAARASTRGFRLMILPGAAALWPWLLRRWMNRAGTPAPDGPKSGRIEATRGLSLTFWLVAGPCLLAWFLWTALAGGAP